MIRPILYALRARKQYDIDGDKKKFIETVWNEALTRANLYSEISHIVKKATQSLIGLTKRKSDSTWINGKDILKEAHIQSYKQNGNYGLWPWLDGTGAGVIKVRGQYPNTSYRIKREFYDTMSEIIK